MSSAICFNLDQSKILLSGNELKTEIIIWETFVICRCFQFGEELTNKIKINIVIVTIINPYNKNFSILDFNIRPLI